MAPHFGCQTIFTANLTKPASFSRSLHSSPTPRAIFLDLDGTLADSIRVMRCVYEGFLNTHGAVPTDAEFQRLNGPPVIEIVRQLKVAHSLAGEESELVCDYTDLIDQFYISVAPFPDAADLLAQAKRNGCVVAVVTSNSAQRTQRWLRTRGLSQFVDFVVSGNDVKSGKPDPEPYLKACELASCAPREIVAVEDSFQGASAAVGAGLKTFVVAHEFDLTLWPPGVIPIASLGKLASLLW
jgi:HAD superfamily hydrolase (TIGR01509 family)